MILGNNARAKKEDESVSYSTKWGLDNFHRDNKETCKASRNSHSLFQTGRLSKEFRAEIADPSLQCLQAFARQSFPYHLSRARVGVALPTWLFWGLAILFFVMTIVTVVFWLYDIKKRDTVYNYSKVPRWQKILTLFLIFYALTYFHTFLFGVYFAMVGGVPLPLFSQYGLWSCPSNLLFVAILAPLVPRVNKPLYISVCINSIIAPLLQQGVAPLAVNLDAMSVLPAGTRARLAWRILKQDLKPNPHSPELEGTITLARYKILGQLYKEEFEFDVLRWKIEYGLNDDEWKEIGPKIHDLMEEGDDPYKIENTLVDFVLRKTNDGLDRLHSIYLAGKEGEKYKPITKAEVKKFLILARKIQSA